MKDRPRRRWATAALASALAIMPLLTSCSDSPTDSVSRGSFAIGDTITGALSSGTNSVAYRLNGPSSERIQLKFQVVEGEAMTLELVDGTGTVLQSVTSRMGDSSLDGQAAAPFFLQATDEYVVRVRGSGASRNGRFRFVVFRPGWQIAVGDTARGHLRDLRLYPHTYTLAGVPGQHVNAWIRIENSVGYEFFNFAGRILQTGLGATGTFVVPASGKLDLLIGGTLLPWARTTSGAYTLWTVPIDGRPEQAVAILEHGDTAVETIDPVGDLDDFHFDATRGQMFNVFLQTMPAAASRLRLALTELREHDYQLGVADLNVAADGSALTMHATGRFAIPHDGRFSIRVNAVLEQDSMASSAYRVWLAPIDPAPELIVPEITPDVVVNTETIYPKGDVDVFTFPVTAPTEIFATLLDPDPPIGAYRPLGMRFLRSNGDEIYFPGMGEVLPPDNYRMEFSGESRGINGFEGTYSFAVYTIERTPETADVEVQLDVIVEESIDHRGDVDEFLFDGVKGQHLQMFAQVLGGNVDVGVELSEVATGRRIAHMYPSQGSALRDNVSGRFTLPSTGSYRITVWGSVDQVRFLLETYDARPESVAAAIAVGDSIAGESIDVAGDMDEFFLTGEPGQEINIFFGYPEIDEGGYLHLAVVHGVTSDSVSHIIQRNTGRITVPAEGILKVQVSGAHAVPYWFDVVEIHRTPEHVSSQVVLGDTITGEDIAPIADIDEFSFNGEAGTQIRIHMDTPFGAGAFGNHTVDFIDPESGVVLGRAASYQGGDELEIDPSPVFQLPRTGTYLIRVYSESRVGGTHWGEGPYRFHLRRVD